MREQEKLKIPPEYIEDKLSVLHQEICKYFSSNPSIDEARRFLEKAISEYFGFENGNSKYILRAFWWVYIAPNYIPKMGMNSKGENYLEFNREKTEKELEKYKDEIIKRIISSEVLTSVSQSQSQ